MQEKSVILDYYRVYYSQVKASLALFLIAGCIEKFQSLVFFGLVLGTRRNYGGEEDAALLSSISSASATKFSSPLYIFCVCSRFGWWAKGNWRGVEWRLLAAGWMKAAEAPVDAVKTDNVTNSAIDNYQLVILHSLCWLYPYPCPPFLSQTLAITQRSVLQIYVCLACASGNIYVCVCMCMHRSQVNL